MTFPVAAVTFDFWNTLAYEERGRIRGLRLAAWAGLLEDAGYPVEREQLDAVFDAGWERFSARWAQGRLFTAAEAAEDALEALGYDVPPDVRDQLIEAFGKAGENAEVHLAPGVADTLRALKARGIRLGIVCDVGFTASPALRGHLERHGVLELFDHWSFSDEVGCYKPDPVIFEHALTGLGVPAERAAHIGDLRRTDVAGALVMGMTAIRYTGLHDDESQPEPEAHFVVADHAELPDLLHVRSPVP